MSSVLRDYQKVASDKEYRWVIDLCGNIKRFGEVKDFKLVGSSNRGLWQVTSNGEQLTNVYF